MENTTLFLMNKPCKSCGKEFNAKTSDKFCIKCRNASKKCPECNQVFQFQRWRSKERKFCSKSCQATWHQRQPEYRAKIQTKETIAKRSLTLKRMFSENPDLRFRTSSRSRICRGCDQPFFQVTNSWLCENCRQQKRTCSICKKEFIPKRYNTDQQFCSVNCWKKSNGKKPTPAEAILLKMVEKSVWQYRITINGNRRYMDVAVPSLKLAIEADGVSHHWKSRKKIDLEKESYLKMNGWTVLRFWNKEILRRPDLVIKKLMFTISQLQDTRVIAS